jgi:hypothetical protein
MLSCEKVSWLSIFPRHVVDAVFTRRLDGGASADAPNSEETKAKLFKRIRIGLPGACGLR